MAPGARMTRKFVKRSAFSSSVFAIFIADSAYFIMTTFLQSKATYTMPTTTVRKHHSLTRTPVEIEFESYVKDSFF